MTTFFRLRARRSRVDHSVTYRVYTRASYASLASFVARIHSTAAYCPKSAFQQISRDPLRSAARLCLHERKRSSGPRLRRRAVSPVLCCNGNKCCCVEIWFVPSSVNVLCGRGTNTRAYVTPYLRTEASEYSSPAILFSRGMSPTTITRLDFFYISLASGKSTSLSQWLLYLVHENIYFNNFRWIMRFE